MYKKEKQEEEQQHMAKALGRQQWLDQSVHMVEEDKEVVLPENEILTIYGGMSTPASKSKLKQVQR